MIGGYYSHAAAVTPSDSVVLSPPCYAFMVGTSGTVTFEVFGANYDPGAAPGDTTPVQLYCIAGYIYPIRCSLIKSTGTAAENIVALW
jgi:hypothetical protein